MKFPGVVAVLCVVPSGLVPHIGITSCTFPSWTEMSKKNRYGMVFTATSTSSTEVRYLDTSINTGSTKTPFLISIYDKRDDFSFRIVNFPDMDTNIPTNPAYGVYISQLVRYARICTCLRQQGFVTALLQKSFNKFFDRHGLIVAKHGATLRKM